MSRRTTFAAIALVLFATALAGCSTATGGPDTTPRSSAPTGEPVEVDAAWLDGGSKIAVVTWGSSTCVPTAAEVALESGVLHVGLDDPLESTACTRDFVPRATAVELPEGVDPAEDLTIDVTTAGGQGETVLAGVPGLTPTDGLSDGGVPSAGWTATDGTFALLTWGSSSCLPVVQDAAVTAAGEITVTFVDPPADQVCTMDFGPRATVVAVEAAGAATAYDLVLHGAEFAGSRVPVVGENSPV